VSRRGAATTVGRALRRVRPGGPTEAHRRDPVLRFAGLLDGRHLWLAADPGRTAATRLALRWADGRVTELPSTVERMPTDAPGASTLVHARVALAELGAPAAAAHDGPAGARGVVARVVLARPSGVVAPSAPAGLLDQRVRRPSSMPPGLRGDLHRAEDGCLELELWWAEGLAHLHRVASEDGAARLVVGTDTGADAVVLLDDGEVVATLGAAPRHAADGDHLACLLDPDLVAACGRSRLVVAVRAPGRAVPVHRRADDLDAPDAAVALPAVPTGDGRAVSLGWDAGGVLVVTVR
jgi:hypothetical protein